MSECCAGNAAVLSTVAQRATGVCQICGERGKSVSTLTVKSLVLCHARVSAEGKYWLCREPSCDAVYFSNEVTFRKSDIKVRVGFKEQQDPIPLCYCFDYTRADISRDLAQRGETDIPNRVKAEIQRGFCACEVKNPSGACCLGDLTRAIQQFRNNHQTAPVLEDVEEAIREGA